MIQTTAMLLDELQNYRYPANKLARMVAQGDIYPVVRGLYVTDRNTPGHVLAASIYGPSYLSFDYALSYWHLILKRYISTPPLPMTRKSEESLKRPLVYYLPGCAQTAYPMAVVSRWKEDHPFLIARPRKSAV